MTARNLLAIKKLPAFKAWLDANNIENRATNAAYQVLQVRGHSLMGHLRTTR